MKDTKKIDINAYLAETRQIATIWGVKDVLARRADLNEDQAWHVLQVVASHLDAECGITWELVESIAMELYPGPHEAW